MTPHATTFVDRLEDELIRAGYSRAPRRMRAVAAAGVAAACVVALLALALRTHAAPAPAAPQCAPADRSSEPVDARLLRSLGVLRGPERGPAGARCAESKVTGGPVYAGGTRYVGPGVFGGRVYIVPVVHWSRPDVAMSPKARAYRRLPGVCVVTVGGPRFDPAGLCASVRDVPHAGAFMSADFPATGPLADGLASQPKRLRGGSYVTLVVPDGIASVRLRYRDGGVASGRVTGNVAIVHVDRGAPNAIHARFELLDARGKRVRP